PAATPYWRLRGAAGAAATGAQRIALHSRRAPFAGHAQLTGGAAGTDQSEVRAGAGYRGGAGGDARASARQPQSRRTGRAVQAFTLSLRQDLPRTDRPCADSGLHSAED